MTQGSACTNMALRAHRREFLARQCTIQPALRIVGQAKKESGNFQGKLNTYQYVQSMFHQNKFFDSLRGQVYKLEKLETQIL